MTRVLIVDDQIAFRCQLRQLLQHVGLSVVGEASDIPTAEILVKELQPHLAIVDIMLPGINGLEGIPHLKALAPAMIIYLVSAYQDSADVFQTSAQQVGAEAFIPKDELDLATVQSWIKKHKNDSQEV
jgi:DNA-binding NarL/FixJ family response regulator